MNNVGSVRHELEVLEQIYKKDPKVRQREISKNVGISLGMTNVILKRLVRKGLLKIQKINNRNIQYIISPKGLEAIARRSWGYFKRTVKNVVRYKEALENLLLNIKKAGFSGVSLMGASDVDFLIEYACSKYRLEYERELKEGFFTLYSEECNNKEECSHEFTKAYLRDILINL